MEARYGKYPEYKNSGIEWVDRIPSHWDICSLRWLTNLYTGGTPDKSNLAYWTDGTIPWLASGEVNQKYISNPTTFITEEAYKNSSAKWVKKDSLLMAIAGQGKTKGTIGHLGFDATCNQSMAAIKPLTIKPRYLFYWLESNYRNIRGLAGDGLRDGLNLEMLGSIKSPIPESSEQTQIATFLDRETAVIDTLIAKQEELIRLLQEKRTAVISHAVTKGLNPHAPLKDSGIEWLGQTPSHWTTSWLKYHVNTINGFGFKSSDVCDEGVPFIRAGNIKKKTITSTDLFLPQDVVDQHKRVILSAGDLVISMVGSHPRIIESAVGQIGIVPPSLDGAVPNQNVVILREKKSKKLNKRFLFYTLWSTPYRNHLNLYSHQLANQSIISSSLIANANFLLPPIEEQKEIVDFLDGRLEKLEKLISKSKNSIKLMKERRTALISAAITGKIDVRHA
ncbi:MAG: restriction endonuclease subunit S [Chloroflexi bacterium]|nr:restriction endonuclease subunit S [Chloroflexota bacterium]